MKRVLFLCTGNYYRSRFAEILFNYRAAQRSLDWRADSCGLHVQGDGIVNHGPLSRWTREAAAQRRLPLPELCRCPRQVSEADLAKADLVIAVKEAEHRRLMEQLHPQWADRIRYWHIHDLDMAPPEEGLRDVERHVLQLLDELTAAAATGR